MIELYLKNFKHLKINNSEVTALKNELKESLDMEEIMKKISVPDVVGGGKNWVFGYGI
jgi:hypothetical protein